MAIRHTKPGNIVNVDVLSTSTSTGDYMAFSEPSSASGSVVLRSAISGRWQFRGEISDKVLKNAIYNHLRFLKARGETQTSLEHISKALDIPVSDVRRLAPSLKGVKVA